MTIRSLPKIDAGPRPQNFRWDAPSDVLAKWAESPQAAATDDDATITMYEQIGEDYWSGGGVTAKRISAALRSIGDRDVTVRINSPGGDMFEGIAIYNLLRSHPRRVTVEVMGWAASAASIIAMAGDEIRMGTGTFMMVHNAWGMVIGNRNDFSEAAETFARFDGAIADIYEARTGAKRDEIVRLMDAETFMTPAEAVEQGFADSVDSGLSQETVGNSAPDRINAVRRVDALLAQQNIPRSERRSLIRGIKGDTQDAVPAVTQDADAWAAAAMQLIETIKA